MNLCRNEQIYRQRVARVVAAIVADPIAEHRLEDLARMAHFSPWHFHRVYHSMVGETVAATVRRVRLALATRLLEDGSQSITQVGMTVGYDSPQAFSRAFSRFVGQSPRAFQQGMHPPFVGEDPMPMGDASGSAPTVQIIDWPAQCVYALRHQGPFSTIPYTHRRLRKHPCARTATEWFGISKGDPDDAASFSYCAAAVSSEPWPPDPDIEMFDIPAGQYALHRLVGPYSRINAAVNALYTRWLPGSAYEPDDRPMLEHYRNSPRNTVQAQLRTDLLIPIRPTHTP